MQIRYSLITSLVIIVLSGISPSASATVTYYLEWDGLLGLWEYLYGDGLPVCLGNTMNAEVSLYYRTGTSSGRVIDEDDECSDPFLSTVAWFISGSETKTATCPKQTDVNITWGVPGAYTIGAIAVYATLWGDKAALTENPSHLDVAYWKPNTVVFAANEIQPGASTQVTVNVLPSSTNFHGNAPIVLQIAGINNTGSHIHSHNTNGTPCGTSTAQFAGTTPGSAIGSYTASAFSQQERVYARGCDKNNSQELTITVKVPGLVEVPSNETSYYRENGGANEHPNSFYLVESARTRLLNGLAAFKAETDVVPFLNDCSLIWGGLYDYTENWGEPHSSHRLGLNADLPFKNWSEDTKSKLYNCIINAGALSAPIHGGNHYHVTFPS